MIWLDTFDLLLQFFKLCVVDKNGILSEGKLVLAIKDIAERSCTQGKPVGILTGNDRDTWAKDYSLLLGLFQFIFSFVPFMFIQFMFCLFKLYNLLYNF